MSWMDKKLQICICKKFLNSDLNRKFNLFCTITLEKLTLNLYETYDMKLAEAPHS